MQMAGLIGGLLSIVIWGIIIFRIIKSINEMTSKEHVRTVDTGSGKTVRIRHKKSRMTVNDSLENRDDDWLAKQLREERAAKTMVSDMFQLKQEHAAYCDADRVKREHYNDCDAKKVQYRNSSE